MNRTNSRHYLNNKFPELKKYKVFTSRKYKNIDNPTFMDNWWFNFTNDFLSDSEYVIFAGALDNQNNNFKIFKVPTSYVLDNLDKVYMSNKGWVNLYIHLDNYNDVRKNLGFSVKQFAVN